jgi:hypothetical protein
MKDGLGAILDERHTLISRIQSLLKELSDCHGASTTFNLILIYFYCY